jgi:hypothetical protein
MRTTRSRCFLVDASVSNLSVVVIGAEAPHFQYLAEVGAGWRM